MGYFYANGIESAFTEGVLFPGIVLFTPSLFLINFKNFVPLFTFK